MSQENAEATLGLRERNKQEKLRRIREAARDLFVEKGFDDTTTREIATRADVALGTLFSYASDKRDLLFLIYNEDQPRLTETAFADVPEELSFLDQLIVVFRHYYRFFGEHPALGRLLLRELIFYVEGTEATRFQAGRRQIVDGLEALVIRNRDLGRISTDADSRTIARLIFSVYQAEIRRWLLDGTPEVETGLLTLKQVLELVIVGLAPGKDAV